MSEYFVGSGGRFNGRQRAYVAGGTMRAGRGRVARLMLCIGGALVAAFVLAAVSTTSALADAPSPTWTSASTLTPDGQSDPTLDGDRIDVAMGSAGDAAVGWLSGQSGGSGTVTAGYRAGQSDATWEVNNITSGATATSEPRVAVADNGDAIIAWEQSDGLYAAYRPAGLNHAWSSPQDVSGTSVQGFSLAIDDNGNAIVAWAAGGQALVAYRAAGSSSAWSSEESITNPASTTSAGVPQVAFDGTGNALLVYPVDDSNLGCGSWNCWGVATAERPQDTGAFGTNSFGAATQFQGFCCAYAPGVDLVVGADGSAALSLSYPHRDSYLAYRPAGQASFDSPVIGEWGRVSIDPAGDAFALDTGGRYAAGNYRYHPAGTGQSWSDVGTGPFVWASQYSQQYEAADAALDSTGQAVVAGVQTDNVTYADDAVAAVRGSDGTWSSIADLTTTPSDPVSSERVATDDQGDATVAWVEDVNGNDVVRVAGLVGRPALSSLSVPSTAIQGDPTTFSVDPRDVWHSIGDSDVTWTFTNESDPTDSITQTGRTISHAFSALGTYDVSVTAVDDAGASVTSAVKQVTVTVPEAKLSADATSGTAPLSVTLDASQSTAPQGATFEFFCGDSDSPVAPASEKTSATCSYDRGSPDSGWGAYVVMHDPATGKDYQDTVNVHVDPKPNTVDDSSAFDAANPDGSITVADDGSLSSNTCTGGQVDTYCTTLDGSEVDLTAAPGTFAPGTQVQIYHGDTSTLQSELGSDVQVQGGFAVTWTPRATLDPGKPLLVSIQTGAQSQQSSVQSAAMQPADLGSVFGWIYNGIVSDATTVVSTIGSGLSYVKNLIGSVFASAGQWLTRPNNSATNDVLYCGQVNIPLGIPSALNPITCGDHWTLVTDVGTDKVAALSANGGLITAGGGNVITAGGGNVITAGGGNVITAGGGNLISQPTLLVVNTSNLITAGGGNLITPGGGNLITAGGGNLMLGLGGADPGFGFVNPTSSSPPTVTATPDPAVPSGGVYSSGPVTVHLQATAAQGASVKNVSYQATGAQTVLNTSVAGDHADVVIDQPGTTTITYTAQDDTLNQAQPQTLTITIGGTSGGSSPAKFVVKTPKSAAAGKSFAVKVYAEDSSGHVITSYHGSPTWSDTSKQLSGHPAAFANGVSKNTVKLKKAYHRDKITVTAGGVSGHSRAFNVLGPLAKFAISVPGTVKARKLFTVVITAEDSVGNRLPAFGGQPQWTDKNGKLSGAPAAFTHGVSTTQVKLRKPFKNDAITVTFGNVRSQSRLFNVVS